ncbi:hypothetical protein GCM10020331_054780 [Ectobacillus funiculus]
MNRPLIGIVVALLFIHLISTESSILWPLAARKKEERISTKTELREAKTPFRDFILQNS